MEISKKLKQARIKAGYSQMWVNSYLGYKMGALYKKEKGRRSFSMKDIQKLCELYNISPNYLLSNTSDEKGDDEDDAGKN